MQFCSFEGTPLWEESSSAPFRQGAGQMCEHCGDIPGEQIKSLISWSWKMIWQARISPAAHLARRVLFSIVPW